MEVLRRRDPNYLVVRQPDGTRACLPEWMTRPEASGFEVRDVPALPREALAGLRALIDAFFLSAAELNKGGSIDATATKDGTRKAVRTGEPHTRDNQRAAGRNWWISSGRSCWR